MNHPRRVALPWYAPEDYAALRAELADGAKLPLAYETWRMATEQVERVVRDSGVEVVRVPIELATFTTWCASVGTDSDGAARTRYAAETIDGLR